MSANNLLVLEITDSPPGIFCEVTLLSVFLLRSCPRRPRVGVDSVVAANNIELR